MAAATAAPISASSICCGRKRAMIAISSRSCCGQLGAAGLARRSSADSWRCLIIFWSSAEDLVVGRAAPCPAARLDVPVLERGLDQADGRDARACRRPSWPPSSPSLNASRMATPAPVAGVDPASGDGLATGSVGRAAVPLPHDAACGPGRAAAGRPTEPGIDDAEHDTSPADHAAGRSRARPRSSCSPTARCSKASASAPTARRPARSASTPR